MQEVRGRKPEIRESEVKNVGFSRTLQPSNVLTFLTSKKEDLQPGTVSLEPLNPDSKRRYP